MEQKLSELFAPVFSKYGIAKSEINYLPGKVGILEVKIMRQDGTMDMDCCAAVSQEISKLLDEIDYGQDNYNLDVCSFGAERVLESDQEISAVIGQWVHVDYRNPKDGLDSVEGELLDSDDSQVRIQYFVKGRKKTAVVEKSNIRLIRLAVRL